MSAEDGHLGLVLSSARTALQVGVSLFHQTPPRGVESPLFWEGRG